MSKKTKAEILSRGLRKQPEESKRDYAVREVSKLSKGELLDAKCWYEANLKTTLPWTLMFALYGVLFSFLLQSIASETGILIPCILFLIALISGCLLSVHMFNVFSGQRYLLGYVNNRLEEMKKKK